MRVSRRRVGGRASVRRAATVVPAVHRSRTRAPPRPSVPVLATAFRARRRSAAEPVPGRPGLAATAGRLGRGPAGVGDRRRRAVARPRVSLQTIEFVAHRLLAEQIVVLIAERDAPDRGDFLGLPELRLRGLGNADANVLLGSVIAGPTDPRVRERILAESRGNPLSLLELPYTWTSAELVEGLADAPQARSVGSLEDGFGKRLRSLPVDTRRLLTLAAAEPLGDPTLLWRAAEHLGLSWGRGRRGGGRGTHRVRHEGSIPSSVGARRGLPRGINARTPRRASRGRGDHRPDRRSGPGAPGTVPTRP